MSFMSKGAGAGYFPDSVRKKDTVTVTFRVDKESMHLLQEEAKRQQISLNNLVNHIINRYIEWEEYAAKAGYMQLTKPVVAELFNRLSDEDIIEIARKTGKDANFDIMLFMKGKTDLESFISWLEARMKNSGIEISRKVNSESEFQPRSQTIVIKHDLGQKWSLYLKTLIESLLKESLAKTTTLTTLTSNTVLVKIPE
jgi:hypothetical protein